MNEEISAGVNAEMSADVDPDVAGADTTENITPKEREAILNRIEMVQEGAVTEDTENEDGGLSLNEQARIAALVGANGGTNGKRYPATSSVSPQQLAQMEKKLEDLLRQAREDPKITKSPRIKIVKPRTTSSGISGSIPVNGGKSCDPGNGSKSSKLIPPEKKKIEINAPEKKTPQTVSCSPEIPPKLGEVKEEGIAKLREEDPSCHCPKPVRHPDSQNEDLSKRFLKHVDIGVRYLRLDQYTVIGFDPSNPPQSTLERILRAISDEISISPESAKGSNRESESLYVAVALTYCLIEKANVYSENVATFMGVSLNEIGKYLSIAQTILSKQPMGMLVNISIDKILSAKKKPREKSGKKNPTKPVTDLKCIDGKVNGVEVNTGGEDKNYKIQPDIDRDFIRMYVEVGMPGRVNYLIEAPNLTPADVIPEMARLCNVHPNALTSSRRLGEIGHYKTGCVDVLSRRFQLPEEKICDIMCRSPREVKTMLKLLKEVPNSEVKSA